MKLYFIYPLIITMFLFFRCTTDPVLIDADSLSEYYVRSKIYPNIDDVGVVVGKTVPENMPVDISGARVILGSANKTVLLKEWKPGRYIDALRELDVQPGQRYNLSISLPEGHVINGTTTVPGDFRLTDATRSDTLEYVYQMINDHYFVNIIAPGIAWHKSKNALTYRVELKPIKIYFPWKGITTIDTSSIIYLSNLHRNIFQEYSSTRLTVEYVLRIEAIDFSYLPYLSELRSLEEETRVLELADRLKVKPGQNDNLTGGLGYFSSFYSIQDTVVVRLKLEKAAR